jgi:hypothetical protein
LFSAAAEKMVAEDYWGAILDFENILTEYPLDPYALHMGYFLSLTIGSLFRMSSLFVLISTIFGAF